MYRKSSINLPSLCGYLFQTRWEGGGGVGTGHVLEREGLFKLVKIVVTALHKELESIVEKLNRGS